ncbi:MAG TPA: alpha-amylase family glycosyl hydrolase [Phototrophicaceae bacterium]|nr:alpha-amylase family glycosyl hydrolase [Phototrophicaceae bacterium]
MGANCQVVPFVQRESEWDTLNWGYLARWEALLPAQPDGTTVQYRIGGWREGQAEVFADFPDVQSIAERAAWNYFHGHPVNEIPPSVGQSAGATFAYHVDTFTVPKWAREAVIYQILTDRFYPGDGKEFLQTSALNQPMGGTLLGVRDRLGYIADLGATCLWLSPAWVSYSVHGYDVIDYMTTADYLGGDAAMHTLIDAAHQRGIRVLFDLPCNHVSHENPYFQEALKDPYSRYRSWFTFDDSAIGYRTFFNVRSMPELNLANPEARDWMVDIGRYWLREFDIDGYRLDVANGPGPDFWTYFHAAGKDQKPDSIYLGEVVDTPDAQRAYVGRLDGCLDFYTTEQLRLTFAGKTQPPADFERSYARHHAHFPADFLLPTFLDNHDVNRFLHIADGDKAALRAALKCQFSLPNPPILYYGTEVGLSHERDTRQAGQEAGRVPMIWGDQQDKQLLADVTAMIHARRSPSP